MFPFYRSFIKCSCFQIFFGSFKKCSLFQILFQNYKQCSRFKKVFMIFRKCLPAFNDLRCLTKIAFEISVFFSNLRWGLFLKSMCCLKITEARQLSWLYRHFAAERVTQEVPEEHTSRSKRASVSYAFRMCRPI